MTTPTQATAEAKFQRRAVAYYKTKVGPTEQVSSYDILANAPYTPTKVKAIQYAASQEQAQLLQDLGAEYGTPIFEGLVRPDNPGPPPTSPTYSHNAKSEVNAALAEANNIAKINDYLGALHRKADNLINHPGQQNGTNLNAAVSKIFNSIAGIVQVSDPVQSEASPGEKIFKHVQRECLKVEIKLYEALPKLAVTEAAMDDAKDIIAINQRFVKKDDWEVFAGKYREIIKTSGSGDERVKDVMEQLAAADRAVAAAAAVAIPNLATTPAVAGAAANGAGEDLIDFPNDGDGALSGIMAAHISTTTDSTNGNATGHNDSGFVDDN